MYKQKTVMTTLGSSIGSSFPCLLVFRGGAAAASAHKIQEKDGDSPQDKKVREHNFQGF
jgi:hypothetical protein